MRTLIVSNRLPVTVERTPDGTGTTPSSGGLATGLRAVHESDESWWVGWPGDLGERPDRVWPGIEQQLRAQRLEPVRLSRKELTGYYERIAKCRALAALSHPAGATPARHR